MELGLGENRSGGSGGGGGSSRWNPTREQIDLLESLYGQGLRTPSAEQIQQIAARLRPFGHIEGKNVFYWFQNHKARQRQKQKQEGMAYFNRLLHKTTHFLYHPPCSNVACGPYYLPHGDSGPCTHGPEMPHPVPGCRRKSTANTNHRRRTVPHDRFAQPGLYDVMTAPAQIAHEVVNINRHYYTGENSFGEKTLPLFPLQPTRDKYDPGDLEMSGLASTSAGNSNSATPHSSSAGEAGHQPFFDFFSGAKGPF